MSPIVCPDASAGKAEWLLAQARSLLAQHRLLEAAKLYAEVVDCQPDCAEALGQLGSAFFQFGQLEAALASLQRAVRSAPQAPKLHLLMGAVLKSLGRLEESAACCEREIWLCPSDADARYNLGLVLQSLGRPSDAVESFEQAVGLRADYVDAWAALGTALLTTGAHARALESFDRAIHLDSNHVESHFKAGTILLLQGHFERGWREYEWRWKRKDFARSRPRFEQPLWDGKDLGGRRILLHCEPGFEDAIQFCRYASLVADRHGEVILQCPIELRPLMESIRGVRQVVTSHLHRPDFDTHAPLMSLPGLLGTRLESIPSEIPYLHAPGKAASAPPWTKSSPAFKVGLAWSGCAENLNGPRRLLRLEMLAPLLRLPGLEWYSLQPGDAANELSAAEFAVPFENPRIRFDSYGDLAQAMCELDLVISVDSPVAHLAGALGRRVWTLLPSDPDWRWMLQREDSPWYPTMRLFRQTRPGDWEGAVLRIKDALAGLCPAITRSVPVNPCGVSDRNPEFPEREPLAASVPSTPLYYPGQTGGGFGWGVCNWHLIEELSRVIKVQRLEDRDPMFKSQALPGDLFVPLCGGDFHPVSPARGRHNFGYVFFEEELHPQAPEIARTYDLVFAGSTWCMKRMEEKGISNGVLLIQGVDTKVFHPPAVARDGPFVLFSGGKFELRKGQDLVLKAFSILSRKYPDMILATAWHNMWPSSMNTMSASPHIRFESTKGSWVEQMEHLYRLNGIDPKRVRTLPQLRREEMAEVYRESDLGLFPNRCEGGTNLVLMEYLACGKPAIVTDASGHQDLCNETNTYLLRSLRPFVQRDGSGRVVNRWVEPSLDEIIARVEYAYEHPSAARALGQAAAADMKQWSWRRSANTIVSAITQVTGRLNTTS